jgi:hypothetical protein
VLGRVLPVALLLALAAAAGCVQRDAVGTSPSPSGAGHGLQLAEFPVPLEHDHTDASLHVASAGLQQVTFLQTGTHGLPDAPIVNLALAKDTLLASLGGYDGSLSPPMSLLVADVKDPDHPIVRSVTPFPGGGVEAVAISDDAQYGFLGTEFTGAVGVWAVSLADPANPMVLGFTPVPTEGPHTLRYGDVNGHHLVFSAVAHVATALNAAGFPQDPIPGPPDLRVDIFEFDPARPQLPMTLLSSYQAQDEDGVSDADGGIAIVHDTFLQVHPITHQPLLYISHWDRGLRILDLSDPTAPKEVGKYTDVAPADFLAVHTTIPDDGLVDGRHYTVLAPICEYNPDQACLLRILDTTDPAHPELASTWQLPGQVHGAIYTPEILAVHAGHVYLPYTHAGFWVLDINSTAKAHAPETQAYFFASNAQTGAQVPTATGPVPWSNSVLVKDGAILLADTYSGLHVLRLNATAPA